MSQTLNVEDLFAAAAQTGNISPAASQVIQLCDVGSLVQSNFGISFDDVPASRVTACSIMPDDSGSIRMAGNTQVVVDGHNLVLSALKGASKERRNDVLWQTRYLNGKQLNAWALLDDVIPMQSGRGGNYNPDQGTPLYDQTVVLLGSVIAKCQEFEDNGIQARSVTLLISDGADMHSTKARAKDVATVVSDMLRTENHIVAGMGISDGSTDFRQVFGEMGIPSEWILTPGNSEQEIRAAFLLFSQSAVTASQHAGTLSQLGGFGS